MGLLCCLVALPQPHEAHFSSFIFGETFGFTSSVALLFFLSVFTLASYQTLFDMSQPLALDLQRKEIRLLRLHQGEPNEDVQCSLYLATLGDDSHYEALSYVWGDAKLRRPIVLD